MLRYYSALTANTNPLLQLTWTLRSADAVAVFTSTAATKIPDNLHSAKGKCLDRVKLTITALYLHVSTNDNLPKTRRHSTLLEPLTKRD